jgi:hypothetical protein
MRLLLLTAALAVLAIHPASAGTNTVEDCNKSWNAHDVNRDGYLAGEEASRFRDEMKNQGVYVGKTKDDRVSANQYNKACIKDFWETFEEDE